jgi:hypothetical protein
MQFADDGVVEAWREFGGNPSVWQGAKGNAVTGGQARNLGDDTAGNGNETTAGDEGETGANLPLRRDLGYRHCVVLVARRANAGVSVFGNDEAPVAAKPGPFVTR